MLQLSKIAKSFGGQIVLRDVSFQVNASERVGLIGANGTGKSTILKIIVGEIDPDSGNVTLLPRTAIGYLSQTSQLDSERPLREEMLGVFSQVNALSDRQRELEAEMQSCPSGDNRFQSLLDEYGKVLHDFEQADGYTVEARVGQVLSGLGFQQDDHDRPLHHFSGGWQMRAGLAKLLLSGPNLLLLDEPTNHLDIRATEWLEDYLRDYRGTVIIVSHDRYFLDRVTQRTLELTNGAVTDYAGNYSFYYTEREKRRETQASTYRRQQTELAKQEEFINRFRAKATKASQVKSRENMLARLERVEMPDDPARIMKLRFPPAPPSGRETIEFKNLAKSYGDRTVFSGGNLLIERGDKIALVGPNGSGKSTLLRLLTEEERPTAGTIWFGYNVIRSYFVQHQAEALDTSRTVIEEAYDDAPIEMTVTDVRAVLGRFLLTGDDAFKLVGQLSGGERSRLALAKMLLRPANVLLLDEPTNHLDLSSIEGLEEAIQAFQGTAIVVSHDRRFLDQVATKVLEIEDGKLTLYLGNYTYYHEKKQALLAAQAQAAPPQPRPKQQAKPVQTAKRVPFATEKRAAELERQITEFESALAAIEEQLGKPEVYQDPEKAAALAKEYGALKERIELLTDDWLTSQDNNRS